MQKIQNKLTITMQQLIVNHLIVNAIALQKIHISLSDT